MDKKRIKLLLISIILVVTIGLSTRSIYFSQPKHKATKQAENFINLLIEVEMMTPTALLPKIFKT